MTTDAKPAHPSLAPAAVPPPEDPPARRPGRRAGHRRRRAVAGGIVGAGAGTGSGWAATATDGDGGPREPAELPPATAKVSRQDLVETQTVDGTLGFGEAHDIPNGQPGTVTWLPDEGSTVSRGQALYRIDDQPVILMYGNLPLYRVLRAGVEDGPDVREVEENLARLGYIGFTVDEHYTDATADGVRRWQADQGLPETGTVDPGRVAVEPDAIRVDSAKVRLGGRVTAGQPVISGTGMTRLVTVDLAVDEAALAKPGGKVTVTLPDGPTVDATIADVGAVAHAASDGSGGSAGTGQSGASSATGTGAGGSGGGSSGPATIDVTVTLDDPASGGSLDGAPVEVSFVSDERKGVLTVPVAALLALREGGYGVQVVDGSTTRIVAVDLGMFANGRVEVRGPGIAAGTTVGVPRR